MRKLLQLLPVLLLLTSCGAQKGVQEVVIEDRYTMNIPALLERTTDLNEDASLQYQNIFQELYIIVIDESVEEFKLALVENGLDSLYSFDLQGYSDLLMMGINMELGQFEGNDFEERTINGLSARVLQMDAAYDGMDIHYQFAYVKGADHYYQVMTWCTAEAKEKHSQLMEDMINSFREI